MTTLYNIIFQPGVDPLIDSLNDNLFALAIESNIILNKNSNVMLGLTAHEIGQELGGN